MLDQYFGIKELYEVVIRARQPFKFGNRIIETQEPVLYFDNIKMALTSEHSTMKVARGGWSNLPRVTWADHSEVTFSITEGVLSSIGMGILFSAEVAEATEGEPILVPMHEGPFTLDEDSRIYLKYLPVDYPVKKTFIYEYDRGLAQKKIYGKKILGITDLVDEEIEIPCVELYKDKELTTLADSDKQYVIDYYYEYKDGALIYNIKKERFNGLFTLEGKFYSKDENEGMNYTNLIYMPKVKIISDIDLRLGERADPNTSVFNIVGMPDNVLEQRDLIMDITRLNQDIDNKI